MVIARCYDAALRCDGDLKLLLGQSTSDAARLRASEEGHVASPRQSRIRLRLLVDEGEFRDSVQGLHRGKDPLRHPFGMHLSRPLMAEKGCRALHTS